MTPAGFTVQAINLFDTISIKGIRSLLSGKVIDSSPQELRLQYGENSYLFVFRFGCLVFFNMANAEIEREIEKLKSALGGGIPVPTTETYQVNVGEFPLRVEFEYVELKKLTLDHLRLIAVTIGQSAALELYEIEADRMLRVTASFTRDLAKGGYLPFKTRKLMSMIGSTATTRQNIVSNLAILDPPDETWKSKELENFFRELQGNFDIEVRFRTLDRKLLIIQDNIELLADLISTRKTHLLETMVILLIAAEIILAFFPGIRGIH